MIEFEPGLFHFNNQLNEMKNAQARVYLMYANKVDAEVIFRDAATRNMTEAGYVWIVTEQALDAINVPEGTIGLKLVNASNELAHIYDSMYARSRTRYLKRENLKLFKRSNVRFADTY